MTSYQNELPSIYKENRFKFKEKNFENLGIVYQRKLKELEVEMLKNNKK